MRSSQPGDVVKHPRYPRWKPGPLESGGGFQGREPRHEAQSRLCAPPGWPSSPLSPVCPPETPLPVPSTVPEEVRARGQGHLCSWTSVDAAPVSPAFFLLYSRGSLLPLWSETAHTLHNQSASTEHLLYAQSCASCCPNPDSTVGNKLGMWPLSITGLIHHGQYHRANVSQWCWM